jgi:hypothetical protein
MNLLNISSVVRFMSDCPHFTDRPGSPAIGRTIFTLSCASKQ